MGPIVADVGIGIFTRTGRDPAGSEQGPGAKKMQTGRASADILIDTQVASLIYPRILYTCIAGLLVIASHAAAGTDAQASGGAARQASVGLKVGAAPTSLKPGDVALVTVRATRDLVEVTGNIAGRPVYFWSAATPREWQGLVGVSLETGPGEQTLAVEGKTPDGVTAGSKVRLTVLRHRFRTRRLTVNATMANPPEAEAARIAREAKAMADAFATLTSQRFWQGPFVTPVPGTPTSSFGRLTITNGKPAGRHQGADFRAASGTPVRAPNAGRVVIAENLYFAGNTVILDHGLGVFSLLAHLSTIDVHVGDVVARGDLLGQSGATGRVTGPHLHWAVRFADVSVDPLALIVAATALPEHVTSSTSH